MKIVADLKFKDISVEEITKSDNLDYLKGFTDQGGSVTHKSYSEYDRLLPTAAENGDVSKVTDLFNRSAHTESRFEK